MNDYVGSRSGRPLPRVGMLVSLVGALVMLVVSWCAWPHMVPEIVTRAAGGRHGQSVATRGVTAVVLPLASIVVAVLVGFAPRLNPRVLERFPAGQQVNARNAARVLDLVLSAVTLVFLVLHVALIAQFVGHRFPVTSAVTMAVGVVLVALGVALPLTRPEGRLRNMDLERVRAAGALAYRPAGYLLIVAGLLVMVLAWLSSTAAIAVGVAGVLGAFGLVLARGVAAR